MSEGHTTEWSVRNWFACASNFSAKNLIKSPAIYSAKSTKQNSKRNGRPQGTPVILRGRGIIRGSKRDQRFENWKDRRALALPYFLRSTTRESRVRKPPFLSTPRSSGSNFVSALELP